MAKHIGIVACSAEGAALCYRSIAAEGTLLMGEHDHPEVSLHCHSLAEYMKFVYRDDWKGVGDLMLSSANKLKSAGADFLICPDNTVHQAMPFVRPSSPLPWLHIAEVVAEEAVTRGFKKIGLTGTRYLVESDVYPEKLKARGLGFLRPSKEDREETNRIIFEDLVNAVFKPDGIEYFQQVIGRLKDAGCDAVVLGCTEIPLIISDANSPLPTLDSTRLLAKEAVQHALQS